MALDDIRILCGKNKGVPKSRRFLFKWIVNYVPKKKLPIEDFLRPQGRFKHLFKPGKEELIARIQAEVDRKWEELLTKANY